MMKKVINIDGMSCEHCVSHVKEALERINVINIIEISLERKNAIVETDLENSILINAIEEEGYDVNSIE